MSEIKISEMIRRLRTDKGISQEALADVCDVSMQAVSKWENGQSCPDISFLPLLAEYFGVSTDYLLTGRSHVAEDPNDDIASSLSEQTQKDDVLYIIQYRNGKIIDRQRWNTEQTEHKDTMIRIQFDDEFSRLQTELRVEVWGNADIATPDVNMNLSAGANVSCKNVQGNVSAGASVNCDVIEGNASAGNSINCDTIEGSVSAGCSISCTTIEGDAAAGTYISCETIQGSAKASSYIEYKNS